MNLPRGFREKHNGIGISVDILEYLEARREAGYVSTVITKSKKHDQGQQASAKKVAVSTVPKDGANYFATTSTGIAVPVSDFDNEQIRELISPSDEVVLEDIALTSREDINREIQKLRFAARIATAKTGLVVIFNSRTSGGFRFNDTIAQETGLTRIASFGTRSFDYPTIHALQEAYAIDKNNVDPWIDPTGSVTFALNTGFKESP